MEYKLLTDEIEDLINLLTKNEWKYHGNATVTEDSVRDSFNKGNYHNDRETFWIIDNGVKVGIVIINDIDDTIPLLYDIRIDEKYRGKGYGVKTLQWLQEYLFKTHGKIRIEAYTREDNIGMRKCFTNAGFVKEGFLRNAWENADDTVSASIVYGATKEDWESGKITPIRINELPY